MKFLTKSVIRPIIFLALSSVAQITLSEEAHWSYKGNTGPEKWAALTPEYHECSGKNQSPVNLSHFVSAQLEDIPFHYIPGGEQIVNNGHSIQINYKKGSEMELDGIHYNLVQFHFHAPSENQIDGVSYPMEAHLVHQDSQGNLAVIAVMFEEGGENESLDSLWRVMPSHEGNKHTMNHLFNVENLLPSDKAYYRFNGSLTTPPCSEGVRWVVMKSPLKASKQQINHFARVMKVHNNRPIQQLNARMVLQ